ncbi:MAG: mannitol-1-phosphate 5-dehydrogenase [Armatimonadota bacterium]
METVVQFGAGNIGRGFVGQLFTEAGYEVVFVDVSPELVEGLNDRRSYPLRLVGPDRFETLEVRPVRAVNGRDLEAVAAELERCAFACTAVGVPALPHLVPALAAGARRRERTLDVILCENQLHCSDLLRGLLAQHLDPGQLSRVGLVESVVSRMVPVLSEEDRQSDPLLAVAEDYPTLPVASAGFLGTLPDIPSLEPVAQFGAYVERKLYVHNMGHAAAAYLGFERGCEYIHEAMERPEVAAVVEGAMTEAGEALVRKHRFDRDVIRRHRENLIRRFRNAALRDTVLRVGRDPIRKLRPDDRLVGAALTCLDWDVEPASIVRALAAAFRFAPEGDPAAAEVQRVVREAGPGEALLRFTGQRPDGELGRRVMEAWETFRG